jgi:4-alpha-glucanotransferase
LPILERLHGSFRDTHLAEPTPRGRAFRAFCSAIGQELWRHAIFEALSEHQQRAGAGTDWRLWPERLRKPDDPEVAAFAREHAERVEFFQYLQWVADLQLAEAAYRARAAGMPIGLYRDLAVATDPGGAAAWAGQGCILDAVSVGAPPDLFNLNGQSWGIAPFSPIGLVEAAYAPFIANLRANMRHAGAVRIDHVMGLMHLYCIPPGGGPGAYVSYPFEDLLRIVALESRRHGCIVIGEDLGTVPDEFRPAMQAAGILSYRLFYFERDGNGRFLPPDGYPVEALVAATTHDLPTLAGFWIGRDQLWRARLRLYPDEAALRDDRQQRARDREELVAALRRQQLLPGMNKADEASCDALRELTLAVHCYLASTPGRILMLQLEDVLGEIEQPNLPGTIDEHPNWRRRARLTVEEIVAEPAAQALVAALRGRRRRTRPRDKAQPV